MDLMTFTRTCEYCGATFTAAREHARFCSTRCRVYWNREHPAGVTRNGPSSEAPVQPAAVTRNEADQKARVKALLDALYTCVLAGNDEVSLLSAELLLALRADLGADWVPGHRLDESHAGYRPGYGPSPLSREIDHCVRTAEDQRGGRGGEWIRLDDARRLIVSAAREAFEVAADEFEFEARRERRLAEEEAARDAVHDAPVALGEETPARGTREALLRFPALIEAVTARGAQAFARRTRRVDRAAARDEVEAALAAAEELTDWATEARDQLDELA
jgi:hypothetical protein